MVDPAAESAALVDFVQRHNKLFVLTGAGCSTRSGIPDYRDANGEWKRGRPVMFQDFIGDEGARQRYWARSLVGWRSMQAARPNSAHLALAEIEAHGLIGQLVTQNVDGLHQQAGSRKVIDLHGRADTVCCLACGWRIARRELHVELARLNPSFADLAAAAAPDGDADLEDVDFAAFEVPDCPECGGMLKPDVVFFGESVPRQRVQDAMAAIDAADAMLVVGSSLMVYSGFRFALRAAEAGKPLAAINIGRTRADSVLTLKVNADCSAVLGLLVSALQP